MNGLSHGITKYRKTVLVLFVIIGLLSAAATSFVSVNYNMVDYLPEEARSTTAIRIIQEEYGGEMPNVRVMLTNVSIQEALTYKDKISEIQGVSSVTWLDDVIGLNTLTSTPLDFLDPTLLKNYYKESSALLTLSVESGQEKDAVSAIYNLIGDSNAASGDGVNTATSQEMSFSEVMKAVAILVPVIILILIVSTTSWIEPVLFLASIGIAVIINMGTNLFFGEVSFITQAISPILQLAVSLDYAIFLLHSFNEFRTEHEPVKAMQLAMKKALSAISASAATTVLGFLALTAMRFRIGPDLGINLVKGVILSFVSVMIFLPALTLITFKYIDKTKHRPFIPEFKGIGAKLLKIRIPFLIIAVVLVVPCFLAQSNTEFMYGMGGITKAARVGRDTAAIDERFGKENTLVLIVPKENAGREAELSEALARIPHINSVVSYASAVGAEIPAQYVPEQVVKQFYSENYTRIILYADTPEEGELTFETIEAVMAETANYYGIYYMAGQSATLYDMRSIVSVDTGFVNLIAIIGIFIVLLITFKSLTMPLILLFTIETAIWINLSFAYFAGQSFNFIGYLVISTVQLGATVDYAILLTDRYLGNRRIMHKFEAMKKTVDENLEAIIISAVILATAGFTLALTSTNPIISELGTLLGRGTVLSFLMVIGVLPALLMLLDRVIEKTTLKSGFYKGSQ